MAHEVKGNSTSKNWIIAIQKNRDSALKELYGLYRNECVDWLQKTYNVSDELAKDAFQLAVVLLYQNVMNRKISELSSSIKSYLFAIAKNKTRDLIKSEIKLNTNKKRYLLRQEIVNQSEDFKTQELVLERVRHTMLNMGDPCKTILELFYFEKLKFREIALIIGHKEVNTTKSKKHKCLKKLQKMVIRSKIIPFEA